MSNVPFLRRGISGDGVYKEAGYTRRWGIKGGGVYKEAGYTRRWGIQGGGVYKINRSHCSHRHRSIISGILNP